MISILLSLLLCNSPQDTCKKGKDIPTGRIIYLNADTGPVVEGGPAELNKHLYRNLKYTDSLSNDIQASYTISFIVEKNGKISGERIMKGRPNSITKQLFSIIHSLLGIPAKCNGHNVPSVIFFQ